MWLRLGEASSLAELLEAVRSAEKYFENNQLWCRGHADADWQLIPSAHRRHPILESQMANLFRQRAPAFYSKCPDHSDYAAWLPLMRHHGLPTRLLDWTESVCVAAFFAIRNMSPATNGFIWLLSPGHLNGYSIGGIIPFLTDGRIRPIAHSAFSGTSEFAHTAAVIAPRTDARMVAQMANFTIHGSREPLETHPSASKFLAGVEVPFSARAKFNHDLSLAGIRLSTLFPDLEHLAEELSELHAIGPDREDLEGRS